MELDQLIPERGELKKIIKGEGEDREIDLGLRPFNLEDESWLKRAFGDELQAKLESMDMDTVTRIAFHQLELDSKRELMKLTFMEMDEDGVESEVAKTGPQKLGQITIGYPDQMELLKVLLKTRGFSMPVLEELGDHLGGELGKLKKKTKKKTKAQKKK